MAENSVNSFNVDGTQYDVEDTAGRARAEEAYKLAYAVNKTVNEPEPAWISHRNIYRGKNLGNVFTQDQLKHIKDGTFEDLYVGDYWEDTSQGIKWMIADIDYWTFGRPATEHHLVIISKDAVIKSVPMNDTDDTTKGYVGSTLYSDTIPECNTKIKNFFGTNNVMPHVQDFSNGFNKNSGTVSSTTYLTVDSEIPDFQAIFGDNRMAIECGRNNVKSRNIGQLAALRINQKDIFLSEPSTIYWVRNITSNQGFFAIYSGTVETARMATATGAVRPIFAIG